MKKKMKDKMERFALLPFSIGCVSESSVAVGANQPRSSTLKLDPNIKSPPTTKRKEEDEESSSSTENMKGSLKFLPLPKSSISKIFKSFKNFAHFFVNKEEIEEMEMEMEIGYPTDVKHVTHIGLDGSASANPIQAWDHLIGPDDQLLAIKNTDDPLRQFELSMAAQAGQVRLVKAT